MENLKRKLIIFVFRAGFSSFTAIRNRGHSLNEGKTDDERGLADKKYLIMHVIIKNYVIMQLDKKPDIGLRSVSFFSAGLAILITAIYF